MKKIVQINRTNTCHSFNLVKIVRTVLSRYYRAPGQKVREGIYNICCYKFAALSLLPFKQIG